MCVNATGLLEWTVTPPGGPDCTIEYSNMQTEGMIVIKFCEGESLSAQLDAVGINQGQYTEPTLNSTLNVTLEENVTVICTSGLGPESVTVRVASKFKAYY